jgi:phosphohistidine phosphatase
MKLYVMRHGPAEDQSGSGLDGDRALTASGRERVRAVAKLLVELGEAPLAVITSPLVRAVQTAEIVALVTQLGQGKGSVEVRREMSPSGHTSALVDTLLAEGRKRVMVVGHEPDLGELVTTLLGKGAFRRAFEKAMVVGLHVSARSALSTGASHGVEPVESDRRSRLRFVLDPKALRLDPDERTPV